MKIVCLSFFISLGWHLIFLVFVQPYLINISNSTLPEARFLGHIVESARVEFSAVKLEEEFFFLDSLFNLERDYLRFPSGHLTEFLPPKKIMFRPDLNKINFGKFQVQDFIILSKLSPVQIFKIELDQLSNPKLVELKTLTGNLEQDLLNWFKVKMLKFYAPFKPEILYNSEK